MQFLSVRKMIDRLVWLIPIKGIRNDLRDVLIYMVSKSELIDRQNKAIMKSLAIDDINYVIVSISGGLGDQIYHLLFGKVIEVLYNRKVKYNVTFYGEDGCGKDCSGKKTRKFLLQEILGDLEIASTEEVEFARGINGITLDNVNEMDKYLRGGGILHIEDRASYTHFLNNVDGLLINKIFNDLSLADKILPKLDNANLQNLSKINQSEVSVAVHIRRGDLYKMAKDKSSSWWKTDMLDYLLKAIDYISKKESDKQIKFFFFSDEMKWVKESLIPLLPSNTSYEIIENDQINGHIDFYLMSCCQYQITSGGGFSATAYIWNKHKDKFLITPGNIDTLK